MKITPREGDYVRTRFMTDEQYHRLAAKLIEVGFSAGQYGKKFDVDDFDFIGIANGSIYYSDFCGEGYAFDGRELSLSDLLGDEEAPPVGKGLPQIGASVLAKNLDNEFSRFNELTVSIVAHFDDGDDGGVVIFHPSRGHASLSNHHLFLFPIKSEREIAIGEMFDASRHLPVAHGGIEVICQALYDAGYRRVDK